MECLLATTNQAKRREILSILAAVPVHWRTLVDLPGAPKVEETGTTFEENAVLKARSYAEWSGLPTLADDGGLAIDALNGEPGVRSRRWIEGRDSSDEDLITYTIESLRGVPPGKRGARMIVVEALAMPDGEVITSTAAIVGTIAVEASPLRDAGFPFRSVFYLPDLGKFYGELTLEEHERVNHRREALVPIAAYLRKLANDR
ncbi:MAG TPA: non-canonical purine NTP pyrophosphatase [Chloroflexota bacterium]|nr:non-canonical purine NTP pyrophosphatase [Chloroflexota bacterium]